MTLDEITRRAEGNPFFAEELVASAAAGQSLTGGLSRVLRARVDQLDDTTQRVLRVIALKGGQHVGHELLSRVAGLPDETLEAALAEAVERHVLEARWPPAYTFRHALLGEAVADTLLPGERLRLHRAYAAVLAERPDLAPASELARHAAAVGDLPTAVAASRAAGEAAMAVGGPQDALQHFERALDWLGEDDPERDALTLRASAAAMLAGEPVRAIDLLRDRLDHPGAAQAPRRGPTCSPPSSSAPASSTCPPTRSPSPTRPCRSSARRPTSAGCGCSSPGSRRSSTSAATWTPPSSAPRCRCSPSASACSGAQAEVRTIMARVLEAQEDLDAVEAHLRALAAELTDDDPLRLRVLHQLASIAHRRGDLPGAGAVRRRREGRAADAPRVGARGGRSAACSAGSPPTSSATGTARRDASTSPAPRAAAGSHDLHGRAALHPGRSRRARRPRRPRRAARVVARRRPLRRADGHARHRPARAGGRPRRRPRPRRGRRAHLDRAWGEYYAIVRLAALVAGQVASSSRSSDPALRERAVALVDDLADRLGASAARPRRSSWRSRPDVRAGARAEARGDQPRGVGVAGPARGRARSSALGRRHRRPAAGRRPRRGLARERRGLRPLRPRLRGRPLAGPARRGPARRGRRRPARARRPRRPARSRSRSGRQPLLAELDAVHPAGPRRGTAEARADTRARSRCWACSRRA